ncbi:DJ-1/PfpI family protein [Cytobacillus sp. FJAT-54145]|uniref:DJ-1/PfpI family protein n=1 Tax=Cytobacillus spartinae TaxID=3299023 RepID=A0ABW6KDB9_9BACI
MSVLVAQHLSKQIYLSRLKVDNSRQLIGSMCSGALLLGGLGLLTGKKATTYPTAVNQLRKLGVNVVKESFVQQGNIVTAAGCLAAQDLTYWIISTLYGEKMASTIFTTIQPVGT